MNLTAVPYENRGLPSASENPADDDPTAVRVGDIVEAEESPRTPTNQGCAALVGHGHDLHLTGLLGRDDAQELVAGFFGLEAGGGPRNEVG